MGFKSFRRVGNSGVLNVQNPVQIPRLHVQNYTSISESITASADTLKFFAEDARFDVICSGSLLGLSYREIESVSVGYKRDVTLRALDFEEFLWSQGYPETITDEILSKLSTLTPFSAVEIMTFQRLFSFYSILGGMPAV